MTSAPKVPPFLKCTLSAQLLGRGAVQAFRRYHQEGSSLPSDPNPCAKGPNGLLDDVPLAPGQEASAMGCGRLDCRQSFPPLQVALVMELSVLLALPGQRESAHAAHPASQCFCFFCCRKALQYLGLLLLTCSVTTSCSSGCENSFQVLETL